MDNNYELESRIASASRPALVPSAAAAADAPPSTSAPVNDLHAMARADGPDFTPILTHYIFLVTFVLAIVSDVFRCAVAPPPVEFDTIFTIKQAGWMTAFIGQIVVEAVTTISTSLLAVELARLSSYMTQIPQQRALFGSVYCAHVQTSMPLPHSLTTLLCVLASTRRSSAASPGHLLRIPLPSIDYRYAFPRKTQWIASCHLVRFDFSLYHYPAIFVIPSSAASASVGQLHLRPHTYTSPWLSTFVSTL